MRVDQAVLYPGFADAVERLAVRPFAKEVRIVLPETDGEEAEELPEPLNRIEENVNGEGLNLTAFSRSQMIDGVARGLSLILVDSPNVEGLRSDQAEDRYPRFRRIAPRNLIGWVERINPNTGAKEPAAIRFLELRTEQVGKWGQAEVPFMRVISAPAEVAGQDENGEPITVKVPGESSLHRWDAKNNVFAPVGEPQAHDFPGIPLVVMQFGESLGLIECKPPLKKLAHMNLAHFKSASRQDAYIDGARVSTLFRSGVTEDEAKAGWIIGPRRGMSSVNAEATMTAVEVTGAAANVGWTDLDRREQLMQEAGHEPMRQRTGQPTATGKAIDAAKASTDIEAWVRLLERGLEQAYEFAAQWEKKELPEDFAIDIWSEFALAMTKGEDLDRVQKLRDGGDLSRPSVLREFTRRGVLDIDPVEEAERIDSEKLDSETAMAEAMAQVERESQLAAAAAEPAPADPPDDDQAAA